MAHGDGRYQAVGYRVNVATGWVSAYPWTGYGMTLERAVQALERVLSKRYGLPVEARRVMYQLARMRGGGECVRGRQCAVL